MGSNRFWICVDVSSTIAYRALYSIDSLNASNRVNGTFVRIRNDGGVRRLTCLICILVVGGLLVAINILIIENFLKSEFDTNN